MTQNNNRKDLLIRILFCLIIGLCSLYIFWTWGYDQRFQIRKSQETAKDILILDINPSDIVKYPQLTEERLQNMLEKFKSLRVSYIIIPEDASFITKLNIPREIKVYTAMPNSLLHIEKENIEHVHFPIYLDQDGVIRSFVGTNESDNFFSKFNKQKNNNLLNAQNNINFRGPHGTFTTYLLKDFVNNKFTNNLNYKIALIETTPLAERYYPTSVGKMTKSEVFANIIDNIIHRRWISKPSIYIEIFYLVLIIFTALLLVKNFSLGISFTIGSLLLYINYIIGSYIFDQYYFWMPILSASLTFIVSYVIFMQYFLAQQKLLAWQIEHEKTTSLKLEELKTNFLSLFSHDLKTPLAKIQATTQLLDKQDLSPLAKAEIEKIKNYTVELDSYIKNILSIAKIKSEQISLNLKPIDVNEFIKQVQDQLQPFFQTKKIKMNLKLSPLFLVEADGQLIKEVILNLMQNAISYSQAGSEIDIYSKETSDSIIIEIVNTPDSSDFPFKDLFQISTDNSTSKRGSGIGLFLVKYFVELHRGEVFTAKINNEKLLMGFKIPIN